MNKLYILLGALAILIAGCPSDTEPGDLQQFIGGTQGVVVSFETNTPPAEAFDGGFAPFDVVVRLQNEGEERIARGDTTVRITGILEPEFNLRPGDLTKQLDEELTAIRQDATGKIIPGNPSFVEFKNFNHVTPITGNALDFPLRADVCYKYATRASVQLCSRENILNPETNGICEVSGPKPIANSGAPVQVSNVDQAARSVNSITFSFDVNHVGTGRTYETDSVCDKSQRRFEDNVFIEVSTRISGLSCTRLESTGSGKVGGFVKMFGGIATITCTQTFPAAQDAVIPATIRVGYDYEERTQTMVTIKHAGE